MAAYTRYTSRLSWSSEDVFMAADCRILVLVEPSLLVRDCLFVRENPADFAANLYI